MTVLSFLEAYTVTGPATSLLQLHRCARTLAHDNGPRLRLIVALFARGPGATLRTAMHLAAESAGLPTRIVRERCRFDIGVLAAMRQLARELQPDIVETHSVKSHFLMHISGVARAVPWVAFHHGYTQTDAKVVLYNECDRVSLRRADRVVTLARAFVDHLTRRGVPAERVMVLHNAIDARPLQRIDEERQRLRALWGIDAGEPVVLCVGRLSREKGHRDLIAALARLKTRHRVVPFRLVVVGDGPERNALQSLAQRGGIADAIRWLGYIENAERLYGGADAAVLPSHSEGSPNALVEAAAYGLPIVATTVGGVPDILEDGESGLLVPPRDPDALAAALYAIVADRTTAARLGRNARAAVAARHDPMTRTCTLIQMYRQLAAAAASCAVHGARACTC